MYVLNLLRSVQNTVWQVAIYFYLKKHKQVPQLTNLPRKLLKGLKKIRSRMK